jgi:hypothetical protein
VAALVFLAVAAVAFFGFFFFRDNFSIQYGMKVVSARVFRAGAIPYWNFHDDGGQPLAGNPNALTFYPDNVLYVFLPAHVAFNLHFLLHAIAAFPAMRMLLKARGCSGTAAAFGAALYALSGMAVSSTAFYNLVVYVPLIPLALASVERNSARLLAVSLGLMLLATEPIMFLSVLIAVAIAAPGHMGWRPLVGALILAGAIGSPQVLAYSEIAAEVERAIGFSSQTTLNASLHPLRLLEFFFWPVTGFLTEPSTIPAGHAQRLYSTFFLGVIALVALFQRSRYVLIAAVMLFFALGRFNPLVAAGVEAFPRMRIARYPEKFAVVLVVALVVLSAHYFERTRLKRVWAAATFVPLAFVSVRALPIDWFSPYRVARVEERRVHRPVIRVGSDVRRSHREGARELNPLFGAAAGVRYALLRSPDNMHSLLSRLVSERFTVAAPALRERYLRMAGADVPGGLPEVSIVPRAIGARDVYAAVGIVESPGFNEQRMAVAPARLDGFRSAPASLRAVRRLQSIELDVKATGPVLVLVNESYFAAWVARAGDRELATLPLNLDRLGVLVPPGAHHVTLTFGRRRGMVALAWAGSLLLIGFSVVALWIEERERRAGQIE